MERTVFEWPWEIMAPEFVILGAATLLSLLDLFLPKKTNRSFIPYLGLLGIVIAIFFVWQNLGQPVQQIMYDMYRLDGFANMFKLLSLFGTGLVFVLSLQSLSEKEIAFRGEYYYLMLTALLGTMIMASSADLLTLFVGLELLTVSSYILVGLRRKAIRSNESAFKYVVNGGISTAIFLFGASYLYGLTGSTNLFVISERLTDLFNSGFELIIYIAFFFILVGLTFKIAAAPYHMWAPDVYQGAPTPVTAFLSVVSKAAGFAIIARVVLTAFSGIYHFDDPARTIFMDQIAIYLAIIAAVTMIVGNTLALRQTNVKRLFAYSSVAQAGYILVPLAAISPVMIEEMIFYLVAYLVMNLGAFAVIVAVTQDRNSEDLKAFSGLYHRSPFTALAMTIFLLSLAGIPVTAGFFGKFYIFLGTIWNGNYWLAAIMILTSVISYYYYFGIIRQMYMRTGDTESRMKLPASIAVVLIVGVVGTLYGGFFFDDILRFIQDNFAAQSFFQIFEQV